MTIRLSIALLTALSLMVPISVLSEECESHIGRGAQKWASLQISEEQKTQIKHLHASKQTDRKAVTKKLGEVREKIKTELLRENPSRENLDRYASEIGEIHMKMNQERIEYLLELKTILTPEQFEQIANSDRFRGSRHPGRRPDAAGNKPGGVRQRGGHSDN